MMSIRPSNAVFVLLQAAVFSSASGQSDVPDRPGCPSCQIVIEELARIGDLDGPGSLTGRPRSMAIDRSGRYWVLTEDSPPMVFAGNGRFLRLIGRIGRGPMEFTAPTTLLMLPGDSVLIL